MRLLAILLWHRPLRPINPLLLRLYSRCQHKKCICFSERNDSIRYPRPFQRQVVEARSERWSRPQESTRLRAQ